MRRAEGWASFAASLRDAGILDEHSQGCPCPVRSAQGQGSPWAILVFSLRESQTSFSGACQGRCNSLAVVSNGRKILKTVPRSFLLRTVMVPRCLSTIPFETHRPSPFPASPLVVTNG